MLLEKALLESLVKKPTSTSSESKSLNMTPIKNDETPKSPYDEFWNNFGKRVAESNRR